MDEHLHLLVKYAIHEFYNDEHQKRQKEREAREQEERHLREVRETFTEVYRQLVESTKLPQGKWTWDTICRKMRTAREICVAKLNILPEEADLFVGKDEIILEAHRWYSKDELDKIRRGPRRNLLDEMRPYDQN